MSDKDVIQPNIFYNTNNMVSLRGSYYCSKDEKLILELKQINDENMIQMNIRNWTNYTDAKKFSELLINILTDKNGFLRNFDNINIKQKNGETQIFINE